jgi:hypothetical protein
MEMLPESLPCTERRPKLQLVQPTGSRVQLAARRSMWRAPRLAPVIWCLRGMIVYVQKPRHRAWVSARVECMVGYRARLSNPMHGINGWYHIDSVRVRHDDHLAMR